MNILFYNSNTNNTDVKNFCYSFFPSAKSDFENLSEKYPEHQFFVVAQKPGVFLLDLENGELASKAEKVQYHLLEKETSPKDFASFIQKLKPDLAISVSYWLSPFDWLSLQDSLIAEYLSENNVKVLCNTLENQEMCFNKWETQLALEAKGFTVPKSIYLSHDLFWAERSNKSIIHNPYKELIFYKLQKLDFPVVIKSLTGFSSYGMDVAKTFPEALHFLTQKSGNEDKIIQEYKDGLHFGLEIYGTKDCFEIKPPFKFSLNKYGITSPKQSVKIGPFYWDNTEYEKKFKLSSLKSDMEQLWKTFGFSGSIQVDLVFSENQWYIIEINPRLSGMTFTYAALENCSPQELLLKAVLPNLEKEKPATEMLCTSKIQVQTKENFENLCKNPSIQRVFQIDNKLATQKRDEGFCEIVSISTNLDTFEKSN